jgi:glucose/arabinose dehydrogenase
MPPAPPVLGYFTTNAFGPLVFSNPVAIVAPRGETNRLFVVEQRGRIAVITNLANPTRSVFLDISSRVVGGTPSDERGLLGLALHPGYATNGVFYVCYSTTSTTPGIATNALHDRLSRFETSPSNPSQANPNSEQILIDQYDQANNHNDGDLHFGPDGYLHVALGDEGGANGQYNNTQSIDKDFFSGLLRIDVDKQPGSLRLPIPIPRTRRHGFRLN